MKKLLILIVLVTQLTWGQICDHPEHQGSMNWPIEAEEFMPGELIVKLKDNVDAGVTYAENGKAMSSFNVGEFLGIEEIIDSSEVLFRKEFIDLNESTLQQKRSQGPKFNNIKTLKNTFFIKLNNEDHDIVNICYELLKNTNVEYAEPNYLYSIDDFEVEDVVYDEMTNNEESSETSSTTIDVNDPLYSSQSNIIAADIDDVWDEYGTGNGTQIIAILDTGIDYTHPDLEANIWINTEELNGVEGYDDDGNGYIDDFRGWDFFNEDNTPLDDNMHGTHVAGIAGAVGNNGIGIAGVAWDVKLMSLKVFQANGYASMTDIVEGINYASENGATIMNMSFSSQSSPLTLYNALATAYTNTILVAAAGNNGTKIGPCQCCKPYYPAGYAFVLGIEDGNGGYDNWDQDGPLYSGWGDTLINYELLAHGTNITSTVPNGGYAQLTGTSMGAPLVSGAVALYNEIKDEENVEILYGDFINSTPCISRRSFYDSISKTIYVRLESIENLCVSTVYHQLLAHFYVLSHFQF